MNANQTCTKTNYKSCYTVGFITEFVNFSLQVIAITSAMCEQNLGLYREKGVARCKVLTGICVDFIDNRMYDWIRSQGDWVTYIQVDYYVNGKI